MNNQGKGQREKGKGNVALRAVFIFSLFPFLFSLVSCGFHLRGTGSLALPAEFMELRVSVNGGGTAYDPLKLAMEEALRSQAGVLVTENIGAPMLVLQVGNFGSEVLSVGSNIKVAEYLLRLEVTFRVVDAAGKELTDEQLIQLTRDYTYDPSSVLAREREERELKEAMQRDVAQQILRRLARTQVKSAK